VLSQFGLTMTEASPLGGNVTRGWRVMTQDGVFVLREHPRDHAPLVRTRHALLRFLEDRFPHAPRVRAGADSVAVASGQLYEVLTYLPGASAVTPDQFDFDDDELVASAGVLLGRMHRVLRSYRPPPTARWPASPAASRPGDALARLARRPEAKVARRALPLLLRFATPPADDRTPRHVVHNDFAWYNCTRLGRRIDGIFDWDAASVASELRDVGYAVYAFAPIGPQRAPAQTEARILAFLDGYADALGESLAASRAQLLDMVAHRVALAGAGLLVRADQGDQRAIRILAHAIGYGQWRRKVTGSCPPAASPASLSAPATLRTTLNAASGRSSPPGFDPSCGRRSLGYPPMDGKWSWTYLGAAGRKGRVRPCARCGRRSRSCNSKSVSVRVLARQGQNVASLTDQSPSGQPGTSSARAIRTSPPAGAGRRCNMPCCSSGETTGSRITDLCANVFEIGSLSRRCQTLPQRVVNLRRLLETRRRWVQSLLRRVSTLPRRADEHDQDSSSPTSAG